MVAYDLATQRAKTSAASVFTKFSGNIPFSAPKGFGIQPISLANSGVDSTALPYTIQLLT